jgi:hypothetical protein
MSTNTRTYNGTGINCGSWQASAEQRNADADANDKTDDQDPNAVVLEGFTGQQEGFGSHKGERVPNLNVTKVSRPNTVHALPDSHRTDQNALRVRQPSQAPARPHASAGETRGRSRGR